VIGGGMGRQIAIAATSADEESLLSFLHQSAEIRLFLPCAATIEALWVDRFAPFGRYHTQYFIWNKAYAWNPKGALKNNLVVCTAARWCSSNAAERLFV
jgi:hypothetical protein